MGSLEQRLTFGDDAPSRIVASDAVADDDIILDIGLRSAGSDSRSTLATSLPVAARFSNSSKERPCPRLLRFKPRPVREETDLRPTSTKEDQWMARVAMRQLLDHAAEYGYGLPAFNVNNMEQIQAIMQAADECDSPVILQGSAGARKYAGEAFLRHLVEAAVETYPHIPVVMHQDHGASPAVCQRAIRSGFSSVMMDGSLLEDMRTPSSYDYNLR
jgi:Fructose-bisphosphate aldolase class-II